MAIINTLLWIAAYSLCLIHITLFTIIYFRYKNKFELNYLIFLVITIFFIVLIMIVVLLLHLNIYPIVLYCLLPLYWFSAVYCYKMFGVNKKYFKIIPILIILEAILESIFWIKDLYFLIYISKIIFLILLILPLFTTPKIKHEKESLEWKIQSMNMKKDMIIIGFLLLIPIDIFLQISVISSILWACFTIAYQIPGLLYGKERLFQTASLIKNTGISKLSKRENEVAIAICKGYKYEEIADKLFISLSAVKKHSYNIYRKLGINNNRELIHLFMKENPAFDNKD